MKIMSFIISLAFSTQAFATSLAFPGQPLESAQDTKVLQVNFKTVSAVTCPGSLKLNLTRAPQNTFDVEHKAFTESKLINALTKTLSPSCQAEVLEDRLNKLPTSICQSYGNEFGTVYIPVFGGKTVKVRFPVDIVIQEVIELK